MHTHVGGITASHIVVKNKTERTDTLESVQQIIIKLCGVHLLFIQLQW